MGLLKRLAFIVAIACCFFVSVVPSALAAVVRDDFHNCSAVPGTVEKWKCGAYREGTYGGPPPNYMYNVAQLKPSDSVDVTNISGEHLLVYVEQGARTDKVSNLEPGQTVRVNAYDQIWPLYSVIIVQAIGDDRYPSGPLPSGDYVLVSIPPASPERIACENQCNQRFSACMSGVGECSYGSGQSCVGLQIGCEVAAYSCLSSCTSK